jgi:phage terminase large subunit-like protein
MARPEKFNPDDFLREAAERLKEVSRKPNIKKYKPHPKQHLFHSNTKKKKVYIGGNRSGKTTAGVCEAIWRSTCTHPYRPDLNALGPTDGRVIGVDFRQGVDKILIPQYKQWIYPSALRGGHWDKAFEKDAKTLNFQNGSTIEFMSYDQDLDKFAGTSRHWVHFDEEMPQTIYIENMARLIDTDGDFWVTMTPVEGMTWIYDELFEPNAGKEDAEVLVIEINTLENPYLSANAVQSFVGSVDNDDVATRIGGAFVQQGGKIYKNFDFTVGGPHVLPHKFSDRKPSELFPEREWVWVIGLDHGLNNPTAVLWMAVNREGFAVVFDEHYHAEWTIDQHAKVINDKIKEHGRRPDIWIADPSIVNRNAITNTSVLEEYQKYGITWGMGNNDVRSGIIRVKRYWNPAKLINRRYEHDLFTFEMQIKKKDEKGNDIPLPSGVRMFSKLRVMAHCTNLTGELKKYRWKTYANKKLQYENNKYDEPHKKDDHACDTLRYMIMSQPDLSADNLELVEGVMSNLQQMDSVDEAMAGLSFTTLGVADPQGLLDSQTGWQQGNDIPSQYGGGGEWQYDEHMGGYY